PSLPPPGRGCPGTATCRRKPRSSVESPVPPPMATTRKGGDDGLRPWACVAEALNCSSAGVEKATDEDASGSWGFRIEQFSEPRIVLDGVKVGVGASLQPVPRIAGDGVTQVVKTLLD